MSPLYIFSITLKANFMEVNLLYLLIYCIILFKLVLANLSIL